MQNNNSNYFVVTIDGNGNIMGTPYNQSMHTPAAKLGVTTAVYDSVCADNKALQETVDLYYDKLVELGALTRPKSQEEINQEMSSLINSQAAAMKDMMDIIKELKASAQSSEPAPSAAPVEVIHVPVPTTPVEAAPPPVKPKGSKK